MDKRTTNFWIVKNGRWIKATGIISRSLLCARPGCRKKPHKAAKYNQKKYCCTDCRYKHERQLGIRRISKPYGSELSRDDIAPNIHYSTYDGI